MAETDGQNMKDFRLRAKLPQYARFAALGVLGITALIVVAGFFRERSKTAFRLKSEHTHLSTDVTAQINGYERLETDGEKPKYYIKAETATTFSDNHQELGKFYLQTYDENGQAADTMTADKALYIPEESKNFTAYMNGDVNIATRDRLKIKTGNIIYTKANETAEADELVEFERDLVRGKSIGANVKLAEKHIELTRDVEIETFESKESFSSNIREARITSGSASYDQVREKIDFRGNVAANILSKNKKTGAPQTIDVHSMHASVDFVKEAGKDPKLKDLELFDNVRIETSENGANSTKIESGYALYDKDADRFALKNSVHIVTAENKKPLALRANEATYEQTAGKIALSGSVEIIQGIDYLRGDTMNAELYPNKKLKSSVVTGNAFLRQAAPDRTTEISANELNAAFSDDQAMQVANAVGQSNAVLIPNHADDYLRVTLTAPRAIRVLFKGEGLVDRMLTDGRTTIRLDAVYSGNDAANKTVTADTVKTFFNDNGKDIRRAEAIGNAELVVRPLRAAVENYVTTIDAPRFDCEFYPTGNNAKVCNGGRKTKTVRIPTVSSEKHGTQTLIADQLNASFSQQTKDIEKFDAAGNAKFTELDRNAIASQMSFTTADETVRLRGGEPTVWDSRARGRAREIDWDTRNQKSYLRGGVSTTYYSRKQMGDAAPFAASDRPVFMTSETAEFDHTAETALYSGNARGWQDNNYVRADRLFIRQREGQMRAEGSVQSALYNAKQKAKGRDSAVPVFASSNTMTYDRDTRLIRYETAVDIRQGTDRITSNATDVYLGEDNAVAKTVAEGNVVVTQPGRRATGDWVQYTAADEVAILRGNPAHVDDGENGSSSGAQLTVYMRDKRVIGEGSTAKPNVSGRTRSVYKIKKTP